MKFYPIRKLFPLILIISASAFADEVSFSVTTIGSFRNAPPGDISFQGSEFTGTTSGGSLTLDNLGTFTLFRPDHGADPYHGGSFALEVLFTLPVGITGSASFLAPLEGTVNTQLGKVLVDFGPPQTFVFSNSSGSGSFDLALNDVLLTMPGPHSDVESVTEILTGKISNATDPPNTTALISNPEPLSMVLLGTIILLISFRLRARNGLRRESC